MYRKISYLLCFSLLIAELLTGCYSFTGGSIPEHLHTLQIMSVTDQSGFGNPQYKVDLETEVVNNFRRDNSFELSDDIGDAKITISITSISEATNSVGQAELETEKRITVNCSAEYYDNVNKKQIWKKTFSNYGLFDVQNAMAARDETIQVILKQTAEDIMLAVVSGW
ncbi:MAG: LPS assembly lipoprotein LptE [Ignavibacteria bacterium]|nr:LPS assembly lipoprotein LptE [Ignavibacteria bacterium]